MEQEIEDAVKSIYKNFKIEINYKDFRIYEIIIKLEHKGVEFESKIIYKYNANLTFNANIDNIVTIIDKIIISFYKRGVEEK